MNKLYAIAGALLLGMSAQAQDLKFYDFDGKEIEDGATYYCNRTTEDTGKRFAFDPGITIVGSNTGSINVTVTCYTTLPVDVDPDYPEYSSPLQQLSLCCGGACQTFTDKLTKSNVSITADTPLAMEYEFKGKYNSTTPITKDVKTEVEVQYSFAPATLKKFTVIFNHDDSGVKNVANDNAVKVVDGAIVLNLDRAAKVAVYDMQGRKVMSQAAEGNAVISTSSLQKGVYVYTVNGGVSKSGKILVK